MKKIFTTTILAFLAFNISLFAQDGKQEMLTTTAKNSSISFYPLNLFNIYEPAIQLAYEHALNRKWAIELDGGIIIKRSIVPLKHDLFTFNSQDFSHSGYKVRVEAKRFIWTNATGKHNFYVSTESFYTHSISNIFTTYVNIGGGVFYDDYTVNKDVVGLNLKIGKQFMFNHFLLELYGGLGVSYHIATHQYADDYSKPDPDVLQDYLFREGKYFQLTLPLNMKVGYRF